MSETGTVEISREQLALYQRAYGTLDKLWTHPKKGLEIKQLAHELDPTIKVPELDLVSTVRGEMDGKLTAVTDENKALKDRLDKFEQGLKDRDDEGKLRTAFDKVRKDYGLQDKGVEEVVALMRDRSIADPEAAAALWARNQPAAPKPIAGPSYLPETLDIMGGFGPEADMKEWLENPRGKFDRVVAQVINEAA